MTSVTTWQKEKLKPGSVDALDTKILNLDTETKKIFILNIPRKEKTISAKITTVRKATPSVFNIGTLVDDRLHLRQAITVKMMKENEFYIAFCEKFQEYGYGNDPISAVDDLRLTLVELYWSLKENQDRLGVDLAKLWKSLQSYIEER